MSDLCSPHMQRFSAFLEFFPASGSQVLGSSSTVFSLILSSDLVVVLLEGSGDRMGWTADLDSAGGGACGRN